MDFSEDIERAVECLRDGGIILYPTDTIWGIGCDATNSEAVKKIYSLKQRSDSKSMLVLVDSVVMLEKIVEEVPDVAGHIIEMSEDPVTIIYDKARNIAPELIPEDGSLGVRITKEEYSAELCRRLGGPIVSTSANISGTPYPSFFDDIADAIRYGVNYCANFRRNERKSVNPSRIIKISRGGVFKIIR